MANYISLHARHSNILSLCASAVLPAKPIVPRFTPGLQRRLSSSSTRLGKPLTRERQWDGDKVISGKIIMEPD
ncbi:hypothetical protein E2C01_027785 [Portunus trituberculatus]|uniref:Uncharacterized protein n=1 Tax=Portunus trituberculatus TaxID=210409 RepID=A0A5B7EM43_PORTR|nr:hypothetical protein [Portunus trituberculatus]